MRRFRPLLAALITVGAFGAHDATAQDKVVCVYDPMGVNGQAYRMADKMRLAAIEKFQVGMVLKPYVEEKTAGDDLAAGKCDAAVLTGVRARSFGLKSATIEAIGALPTYSLLKSAIGTLARTDAAVLMKGSTYETAGIFPAGAVYLYVRDGNIRKASQLAGKKISAISDDSAANTMIREIGATGVGATTATFGPMFNSGSVDACYAPATAFEPLELYRGVGQAGGIIDFPLSQLTFQFVVRHDKFPAGFGQWGREYAYGQYETAKGFVTAIEGAVKSRMLTIPSEDKPGYDQKFQAVRVKLRDQGVYDKSILTMMRRLRCGADGSRAECATTVE